MRAGGRGDRVEYVGGTIAELPRSSAGVIDITGDQYFHYESRSAIVEVPYESINVLEYGRTPHVDTSWRPPCRPCWRP